MADHCLLRGGIISEGASNKSATTCFRDLYLTISKSKRRMQDSARFEGIRGTSTDGQMVPTSETYILEANVRDADRSPKTKREMGTVGEVLMHRYDCQFGMWDWIEPLSRDLTLAGAPLSKGSMFLIDGCTLVTTPCARTDVTTSQSPGVLEGPGPNSY